MSCDRCHTHEHCYAYGCPFVAPGVSDFAPKPGRVSTATQNLVETRPLCAPRSGGEHEVTYEMEAAA